MIKLYGMHICPDCEQAREQLLFAGVDFEFLDFADSTANLKEFLKIRDTSPLFEEVRREGKIGIPCFVREDGSITLEAADVLKEAGLGC